MGESGRTYVPAAGHDWVLPLYVKLLGGDRARKALLDQAALRAHHRILDIGCGTGTLVVMLKRLHPDVDVVGLDPDPKALARARRKAERSGVSIQLDRGFSDELPYPEASFERVFSSFMLHHLSEDEKERSLREARRILKPCGFLHLVDSRELDSGAGYFARCLHWGHRLSDNSEERILALMRQAGFADSRRVSHGAMLFLGIAYYEASVSSSKANAA